MSWTTPRVNAALATLGTLSLGLYVLGGTLVAALRIPAFTATALGLALPYFAASWLILRGPAARSTWFLTLVFAALFRLAVVQTPAYLSTDLYRYIWDGRVQAAGINPYRSVPAAPELAAWRDRAIYPHINRKDYARTIYPPVAQGFFLAVTRVSESVTGMRVALVFCEAVALWAIARLLSTLGLPRERALLYAWHPLAVWEFAGGGHVDALMIALVALALLARRRGWAAGAGACLAGATLVKLFPIVLFPAVWRRWGWKMPVAFAGVAVAAYAPYVWTLNLPGVLGFLPGYTTEEGLQSGDRFYLMNLIPGFSAYRIFTGLALGAMAGAAAWSFLARERDDFSFLRRALALGSLFLAILAPGYDWYYTWLIPFLCFLPYPWLFWLTSAVFILYLNWDWSELSDAYWQNSFIYLPAALLGVFALIRRRLRP